MKDERWKRKATCGYLDTCGRWPDYRARRVTKAKKNLCRDMNKEIWR